MSIGKDKKPPVTVIATQFKGFNCPRFHWVAFAHHHAEIPPQIGIESDFEKKFFKSSDSNKYIFGMGDTPGQAIKNMYKAKREN